ncbi:MAG: PhzF family phenazine biosynthesis protein [Gemmataceae bacterium]
MLPRLPLVQVDAFASKPFTGNPAAVCLLDHGRDDAWKQAVGRQLNLRPDGFDLRWFTPTTEVDLCGHATLASAHVLWEREILPAGQSARFHTRSGLLTARRAGNRVELDFPSTPALPAAPPAGLAEALGAEAIFVGRSRFYYLLEFSSEEQVRGLRPDFKRLSQLPVQGVIVTSRASTPEFDFVSRFFAPAAGVDEDPVTGSAHCSLAPYWHMRLGKDEMTGYQASARGGVVGVRVAGERVFLTGQAITIWQGELLV